MHGYFYFPRQNILKISTNAKNKIKSNSVRKSTNMAVVKKIPVL